MALEDSMCSIVPYFTVKDGKMDEFKAVGEQMVTATKNEKDCLFYGWSFHENRAFCREAYTGGEGLLAHLKNVDSLLKQALAIASLDIFEIHGPAAELEKLREPLSALGPVYFTVESGFRN